VQDELTSITTWPLIIFNCVSVLLAKPKGSTSFFCGNRSNKELKSRKKTVTKYSKSKMSPITIAQKVK
jgi:hypothetical protein